MKKCVFFVTFFVSSVFSLCQATIQYSITDLGTLGGNESWAYGINEKGQVVGSSEIAGNSEDSICHAFLYDGTSMKDIGTLGGNESRAYSINNSGQIVGSSDFIRKYWSKGVVFDEKSVSLAFLYGPSILDGTSMFALGTFDGGDDSVAYDLNEIGHVVGGSEVVHPINNYTTFKVCEDHAFLYNRVLMMDLGTLQGKKLRRSSRPKSVRDVRVRDIDSRAYGINSRGQIVGESRIDGDFIKDELAHYAFLYNPTTTDSPGMKNLGTLGGRKSSAHDINDSGQVVGSSYIAGDSASHAFLYNGFSMKDLETLGGRGSWAEGINNRGQIVGGSNVNVDEGPSSHAFLYDNNKMIDLNNLIPSNSGWVLTHASDINSLGQIVGWGKINGETHAFLITPSP